MKCWMSAYWYRYIGSARSLLGGMTSECPCPSRYLILGLSGIPACLDLNHSSDQPTGVAIFDVSTTPPRKLGKSYQIYASNPPDHPTREWAWPVPTEDAERILGPSDAPFAPGHVEALVHATFAGFEDGRPSSRMTLHHAVVSGELWSACQSRTLRGVSTSPCEFYTTFLGLYALPNRHHVRVPAGVVPAIEAVLPGTMIARAVRHAAHIRRYGITGNGTVLPGVAGNGDVILISRNYAIGGPFRMKDIVYRHRAVEDVDGVPPWRPFRTEFGTLPVALPHLMAGDGGEFVLGSCGNWTSEQSASSITTSDTTMSRSEPLSVGTDVWMVCFPKDECRLCFSRGRITAMSAEQPWPHRVWHDLPAIPGSNGALLWDTDGRAVAVHVNNSSALTFACNVALVNVWCPAGVPAAGPTASSVV